MTADGANIVRELKSLNRTMNAINTNLVEIAKLLERQNTTVYNVTIPGSEEPKDDGSQDSPSV